MKFYITTPIYYINDRPHIGHAYATIAADVLARYHRQRGDEVFFLAGTAEHGDKIATSAEKAGVPVEEFCDRNAQYFIDAWQALLITNDDFIRTTQARHEAAVKLFATKLKDSGQLYEKDYEGLYCVGCESFKRPSELADGKCPDHGTEPQPVKERNWFFKLSEYGERLEQAITSGELVIEPESRRNEMLSFIRQGLDDITVSRHNSPWAITLPWDSEQTLYVWLDELFNYCTAVGYGVDDERFKKWWPVDLHLVGKDIARFHTIIWPALLMAIGESIPKKVFATGLYTVDGQKMSKTLGNVINPLDLVNRYGADATRYLLLSQFPFGNDGDIKAASFDASYATELANGIGNLASRVIAMSRKNFDGAIAGPKGNTLEPIIIAAWKEYHAALESCGLEAALGIIKKVITACDQLIEQKQPWSLVKTDQAAAGAVLYELCEALRHLSLMLEPYLPTTMAQLRTTLGATNLDSTDWGQLEPGTPLAELAPLFPRINE
ncbi:MAG: methionine--tRNA ligase [Candidatus Buchananbacteria bacterium]|nr:methionine--tRNA ligase [Candidatus Buchananbacteria bacterium]